MTWSHPRGHDPLVACSALWREKTGVAIQWDERSLQDFESFPIQELARRYDLIVIDHPHVGQITAERCLAPLDVAGREAERNALASGSVGESYPSYNWQGGQWAFPIDAATQVQAWRPITGDRFDAIRDGVFIAFIEPVRFVKILARERIRVGQRALECRSPPRDQRGAKIRKTIVAATTIDNVGRAPQRPIVGLVHHGIELLREPKRLVLLQGRDLLT